ncbi:MAG: serine hydrolase [Bacteroidota bacterium]
MTINRLFSPGTARAVFCLFVCMLCFSLLGIGQFSSAEMEKKGILLRNDDLIPVKDLATTTVLVVSIGSESLSSFQKTAALYTRITSRQISLSPTRAELDQLIAEVQQHDLCLVGLHGISQTEIGPPYVSSLIQLVRRLAEERHVIVSLFAREDRLPQFPGMAVAAALLQIDGDGPEEQAWAAQLIFGGMGAKGKLSLKLGPMLREGDGIMMEGGSRLAYVSPESIGWEAASLESDLAAVIEEGLEQEAYPGCQVLVAKDGKVVFHKAYGYHTYDRRHKVRLTDIYDYASMTKVTGALPVLMQLVDQGKFDLDEPMATYWPDFKRSNKKKLIVREILAHQAKLKAWIAYYEDTKKKNGEFKAGIFSPDSSEKYSVKVGRSLFLSQTYRKKIYKAIRKSPLNAEPGYLYSGLSFYLYPSIIEELTGTSYEEYCKASIYQPLGAHTITYNAWKHFPLAQIVPTEQDSFFRKELLHGYVHDEGASMMGGVSSNAGLFSTANDLAKLMQMYLNYGTYGGKRYINEATLKEFTRYQYPDEGNRRGLGFDKPLLDTPEDGYAAPSASALSFGHSGYTGTFAWADPENGLLFIFFSNRVHPTRNNRKLYDLSLRPRMHEVIYRHMQDHQ